MLWMSFMIALAIICRQKCRTLSHAVVMTEKIVVMTEKMTEVRGGRHGSVSLRGD